MGKQHKAIINISKVLLSVSLPTLAVMGGATGNVWLAGLAALPAAVLSSAETWKAALQPLQSRKESFLELPLPNWWHSDARSWQGVCAEIEQALPSLLQEIGRRLQDFQEVVTVERVQQFFIEALVAHPLTWAPQKEERRNIGAEIAAPILTKVEQVLTPLVEQKQRETALSDLHTTSAAASKMLSLLERMYEERNKHKQAPDLERLKARYFASLREKYEYMDLGGISPRVTSKAESKVVSIRMEDVFIPLKAQQEMWNWAEQQFQLAADYRARKSGGTPPPGVGEMLAGHQEQEDLEGAKEQSSELTYGELGDVEARTGTLRIAKAAHVDMPQILTHRKVVILGHPGAGKTTLAKYVAFAIAQGKHQLIGEQLANFVPLLVKAADYGKHLKKDEDLSFFRYVTGRQHTDEYGPLFQWALQDNRCLVMIDGLDEVPDPIIRARVATRIEQFVSEYPGNRFVISSRIVGYKENQLTGNFVHVQLTDWQPGQILTFLEHWYLAVMGRKSVANKAECKKRARTLWEAITKNEGVKKLAGTPLLLTIIALVNYYGNKLPERRVELYQLATETLLSNWPMKQREQKFDLREILSILEPIAHQIFTTSPDRLITEYEFRPLFEEQVSAVRGTNARQTQSLSTQLLKKIEEHTGFFLSRGTNEKGQQLYGFLHPTFAEYLTARHVAYHWLKTHQLEIAGDIHQAAWHEVVLLMAGYLGTLADVLAAQLLEYIEQLNSPYEPYLHRDLLLVAEILGDDVPVAREKVNWIVSKLISLALETPYSELWEVICIRLANIARAFPFASQPKQLKPLQGDALSIQVRKVILSRYMGFHNEIDLETLWKGLWADEETVYIAHNYISRDFLSTYKGTHYYLLIESKYIQSRHDVSEQFAQKIQKLRTPVFGVENLAGTLSLSQQDSTRVWLLNLQKLPTMRAIFAEPAENKQQPSEKSFLLSRMLYSSSLLEKTLLEWVERAASKDTGEDYQQALDALDHLPDIVGTFLEEGFLVHLIKVKEAMMTSLASFDDSDRARVLRVLVWGTQSSPDWSAIVHRGLSDAAKEVQVATARMAGSTKPPISYFPTQVLEKLRELLGDNDLQVVNAARNAMIRNGIFEERDLPFLLEGIPVSDEWIEGPDVHTLVADIAQLARKARHPEMIQNLGTRLRRILASADFPDDEQFWYWQTKISADSFTEKLSKSIVPLFKDPDPKIRYRAVVAWKKLQPAQRRLTVPFLELLKDSDMQVRRAAISSLKASDLSEIKMIDTLLEGVKSDIPIVREQAISLLNEGRVSSLEVVDALLELVRKGDRNYNVVRMLSNIKEPAARQKIIDEMSSLLVERPENKFAYRVLWALLASKN